MTAAPPDPRPVGPLESLAPGQLLVFGGDRVTEVSAELADVFRPGDRLVVVQETGDLLHIPASEHHVVDQVVGRAVDAFAALSGAAAEQISGFFRSFADHLADNARFAAVADANERDVQSAKQRGRSTTRLVLDARMRADMVAGLEVWATMSDGRDRLVEEVRHDGWTVEARLAPLGVVGFVFEGRPNVFADATGVLRSGNAAVFRIGSDALGTARAIMQHALEPALVAHGLPVGAVGLVDAASHAAGWALFADRRLSLAVARGSGPAVAQLGAVARQSGVPVSLHGTGGAWLMAGQAADRDRFSMAVLASLDRKVCNTLNVCCIPRNRAAELVPELLAALTQAAERRGAPCRLHVVRGAEDLVPSSWFETTVDVLRGGRAVPEPMADVIAPHDLGVEWEWEESPEVSLVIVDGLEEAVELCNRWSPHFVASLISEDHTEQDRFWRTVDAPFVGTGFTRWVDGQYALGRPELGLSNWQHGRLFARGGVLSGDSVHTVRLRAVQDDPALHR
jgi:glutamate-5-semialdehyde dehydrogenase